jgi:hypothetical protein
MKLSLSTGIAAGILALTAAAAPALAAPTVTVRVEGAGGTLLERTTVTLGSEGVAGTSCTGDTAGAAIEAATRGNWNRQDFVSTLLGETHAYPNPDYWAEWVDRGTGYKLGGGVCSDHLADGDEVLMLVDFASPTYTPVVFPLDMEGAPASVTAGTDVAVTVVDYRGANVGEGVRTAVAGATVTGGAAPVTTGADGKATVRLDQVGTAVLKATKAGDAPSAGERVAVVAAGTQPATAAPLTPATSDKTAPLAKLTDFKDHQVFTNGPRELRGSFAADPSGIRTVKLRLTKRVGKKCWYFSGKQERFRGTRCGRGAYFAIGDRADWSYLLPAQLGPGRYVLDAVAIDGAGNRTPLQRGSTRVVFSVR